MRRAISRCMSLIHASLKSLTTSHLSAFNTAYWHQHYRSDDLYVVRDKLLQPGAPRVEGINKTTGRARTVSEMSSNPASVPNPAPVPIPVAALAAASSNNKAGGGAVPVTGTGAGAATTGGKKDPAKIPVKKKVRRKKPPSTKGPTSQAIVTAAKNATGELNSFKAEEFAKRKDPLWYRTNEVLQAISGDSSPVPGLLAEQVDLVEAALQRNHLTRADVTPQAFGVLLEQARRYALEIVADAQDCAHAAHRHEIQKADLSMALELRTDQPNSHMLVELQKMTLVAHNLNRIPIPPIPQHCYSGVVLPPKPHQLTSRTFDILTGAQTAQKMKQPLPSPRTTKKNSKSVPTTATAATSSSSSSSTIPTTTSTITKSTPSYGATRGRLIPISLQTKPTLGTGPSQLAATPTMAATTTVSTTTTTIAAATTTATSTPLTNVSTVPGTSNTTGAPLAKS